MKSRVPAEHADLRSVDCGVEKSYVADWACAEIRDQRQGMVQGEVLDHWQPV